MYPIRLGYSDAIAQINRLLDNDHPAEALVTAVFTAEKMLRRTLRQLVVSAGFKSCMADKIIQNLHGIEKVKDSWELFDPKHRKLITLIHSTNWQTFKNGSQMRNNLIHGVRVYPLSECRQHANAVLAAIHNVKTLLDTEYGYSGWFTASARRSSQLHKDAKVRIVS